MTEAQAALAPPAPRYDRERLRRMLANEADMAFKRRAEAVFDFLDPAPGEVVLDMGCGRGFFLSLMRALFPEARVTGVELERALLPQARARVPGAQVVSGTIYQLPFADGHFDKVVFTEVLEHIPDDAAALRELYRVTRPGGLIGLTTPHENYPFLWDPVNKTLEWTAGRHIQTGPLAGIWANHVRLYSLEGLARLVTAAGFEIEETRTLTHYCFPFIHNIVYGVGKPLLERGLLPAQVADAADRHRLDGDTGGLLNPVRLGLALFNAVDALNDLAPTAADTSFLLLAMKLRKPERAAG